MEIDETKMKREAEDAGVEVKNQLKWYKHVSRNTDRIYTIVFLLFVVFFLIIIVVEFDIKYDQAIKVCADNITAAIKALP